VTPVTLAQTAGRPAAVRHNVTAFRPRPRRLLLPLAGGMLALVLGACGGSGSSSSASNPASGGGTPIAVTLKDFSITMGSQPTAPRTYTFTVKNDGPSSHNLTVDGPGVSGQATPTFGQGETNTLTVTLKNGRYDFFCSVPGHKAAGMDMAVTVGSGGSSASSSTGGSSAESSSSGGGWS
jgi:copper binding plastocyanin/azurin family protein